MCSRTVCSALQTVLLAAALWISASSQSFGQSANGTGDPLPASSDYSVKLFDTFNGKIGLAWKFVRHDPTHVSFSDRPGMLTIRTQRGTINKAEKALGWPQAKNLFLVENPLPKEADFQVTTCLDRFRPTELFQQAGLLLYNDDDNYLKWIVQFNRTDGVGQVYSLMTEQEAVSEFRHHPAPHGEDKLWLRLVKRGGRYLACGSTDGQHFQVLETRDWPVDGPTKLGLVAKNGGGLQDAAEMDAHFDFFELTSPLDEHAIAGAVLVRGSITINGMPLADGRVHFHSSDGQIVGSIVTNGKFRINSVPAGVLSATISGNSVPQKYADHASSMLKVEVRPGSNQFNFDLRSP